MNRILTTTVLTALAAASGLAQDGFAPQDAPPVSFHAAAHDIARGVTVAHDVLGRTFEWDGSRWKVAATDGPTTFNGAPLTISPLAMTYDIARSRCVMFEGPTGITWSWDGQGWSQLATTGPGIRVGAAMAYDLARDRVVLHGGQTSQFNGFRTDTWEWDGASWSLVANSGPRTSQHGMAYDAIAGELVLHGGVSGILGTVPRRETWTFDGTTWALVATTGPAQTRGPLAFDLVRGRTVAVIATATGTGPATIWEWDGSAWTQASTVAPLAISAASALVYEPGRSAVLGTGAGETFAWNGATVTDMNTEAPPILLDGIAAYDEARQELIALDKTNNVDQTWVYDGSRWRVAAIGAPLDLPDPRLAYDPVRNVVVLMAQTVTGQAMEVWEWDGVAWRFAGTANGANGTPAARREFDITFDPNSGGVLLFGGLGPGFQTLEDTWSWDGQSWTLLATTGPGRTLFRVATDTRRSSVVLFGGANSNRQKDGETWEWDGQQWLRGASTGPLPRTAHDMAYDPVRARVVMHGGFTTPYTDDSWEWDGRTWQRVSIQGLPSLCRHGMFFDTRRQQIGVFAGRRCSTGNSFRDLGWIERQALGEGCGPSTPPTLSTEPARPSPGAVLNVNIDSLPASANSTWLGIGLEPIVPSIDLTPAQMPGCGVFVQTRWLNLLPAAQGSAMLTAPLPNNPTLSGLRLYAQAATLDPSAPGLGITTSNGVVVLVR